MQPLARGPGGEIYLGGVNFNALAWFQDPTIPMADGTVLTIAPDGTMAPVDCSVTFPNGFVISPDGDRVMMADSYRGTIKCWQIHADGAIWFASHNRVLQVREGGEVTDAIEVPEGHATACALGGDDGRTLLITAAASIDRSILHASRTGVLYETRVDVPGVGLPSLY